MFYLSKLYFIDVSFLGWILTLLATLDWSKFHDWMEDFNKKKSYQKYVQFFFFLIQEIFIVLEKLVRSY
jgi:hypothetical protein